MLVRTKRRGRQARPASKQATGQNAELLELWQRYRTRGNAADAMYATLREAILRGILPPGSRLGEIQLTEVFRRSRTPVREAILRLESEGLAERLARRGLVVGQISRDEILEVYAVREALDGLSARLAAYGILPNELEQLTWLNERLRDAAQSGDYETMLHLNIEFHEAIARASRNSLLLQFMRQIHDWVRRCSGTTFTFPGRALEAMKEHDLLLDALRTRNPDEAERIAREHMNRARHVRVAMLHQASPTS